MVRNVVVGLKPNPLLTFGKKSVVAGLSFAILHYCKNNKKTTTEDHNIEHRKRLRNDDVCQLSANRGSLTVFVAFGQCLQIIYMVVVIAWCAQDFKWKVTYDGRSSGQGIVLLLYSLMKTSGKCTSLHTLNPNWVIFTLYLACNSTVFPQQARLGPSTVYIQNVPLWELSCSTAKWKHCGDIMCSGIIY